MKPGAGSLEPSEASTFCESGDSQQRCTPAGRHQPTYHWSDEALILRWLSSEPLSNKAHLGHHSLPRFPYRATSSMCKAIHGAALVSLVNFLPSVVFTNTLSPFTPLMQPRVPNVCAWGHECGWVGGKRYVSLTFCLPCPYHFEHFTFPHCLHLGQRHSPLPLHTSEDVQHTHHISEWDKCYYEEQEGGLQRDAANGITVYSGTSL